MEVSLLEFASECQPKLTPAEARGSVKSAIKLRFIKDQTIADMLDITPDEAATLDLKVMHPRAASDRQNRSS